MGLAPSPQPFIYSYSFTLRRNRYLTEMRQSLAVNLDSDFKLHHIDLRFDGTHDRITEQVKRCYVFEIKRPNHLLIGKFSFPAGETIDFSLTPFFKYKIPTASHGGCTVHVTVFFHGFKRLRQRFPARSI